MGCPPEQCASQPAQPASARTTDQPNNPQVQTETNSKCTIPFGHPPVPETDQCTMNNVQCTTGNRTLSSQPTPIPFSPAFVIEKNYLFLTEDGFGASTCGIMPRPNGTSVSQEPKISEISAFNINNQQNKL
jgi:hypothetical protein